MDGHKDEGLSGEALAREIEAALGVDPSPEFLPRVRARIARERLDEGWFSSASWRWTGAAAVVAMVAVIAVWTLHDPTPAQREVRITPPVETVAPQIRRAPSVPALVASPAKAQKPAVREARAAQRPEVTTPFEVVIAPDEAAALKQLFTAISDRRIETSTLPDLQSTLKPPAPIEEIALEPITISPLAALEGE